MAEGVRAPAHFRESESPSDSEKRKTEDSRTPVLQENHFAFLNCRCSAYEMHTNID